MKMIEIEISILVILFLDCDVDIGEEYCMSLGLCRYEMICVYRYFIMYIGSIELVND